jgi:DNA primase catalytic subunit
MSKRYGRKQKRAHRETIADLAWGMRTAQHQLAESRVLHKRTHQALDDLREVIQFWDGEIRSLLGPYTSFSISDVTFRVSHPDSIRQMPIIMPVQLGALSEFDMVGEMKNHVQNLLHVVCSLTEEDHVRLSRFISIRLKWGDQNREQSAFALSEAMWQHMRADGGAGVARLAQRIMPDLIRLIVDALDKDRNRRRA